MTQEQMSKAKNFGFVARMNGQSRVPVHCKKFMNFAKNEDLYNSTKDAIKAADLWLKGWDEANLDYVLHQVENSEL